MTFNQEKNLSEKDLQILYGELQHQKKSLLVAYLLWLFTGACGFHAYYLGRPVYGTILLVWSGIVGLVVGLSIFVPTLLLAVPFMIAPVSLCLFIDLFTIPGHAKKLLSKAKEKLISELGESQESD